MAEKKVEKKPEEKPEPKEQVQGPEAEGLPEPAKDPVQNIGALPVSNVTR